MILSLGSLIYICQLLESYQCLLVWCQGEAFNLSARSWCVITLTHIVSILNSQSLNPSLVSLEQIVEKNVRSSIENQLRLTLKSNGVILVLKSKISETATSHG